VLAAVDESAELMALGDTLLVFGDCPEELLADPSLVFGDCPVAVEPPGVLLALLSGPLPASGDWTGPVEAPPALPGNSVLVFSD
jgi:hypothetical protein